jgi:hypothetical protein
VRLAEAVALYRQDPAAAGAREDEDPDAIVLARSNRLASSSPRLLYGGQKSGVGWLAK